jgi:hypothetical protein
MPHKKLAYEQGVQRALQDAGLMEKTSGIRPEEARKDLREHVYTSSPFTDTSSGLRDLLRKYDVTGEDIETLNRVNPGILSDAGALGGGLLGGAGGAFIGAGLGAGASKYFDLDRSQTEMAVAGGGVLGGLLGGYGLGRGLYTKGQEADARGLLLRAVREKVLNKAYPDRQYYPYGTEER